MFGDLDDLDDLLLPDDPFPAAEPPPDAPLLSVEWDGEHVVRLG